jgi:hypothetical protein
MKKEMEVRCFIDDEEVDCKTLKEEPSDYVADDEYYKSMTDHDDGC